MVDHVIAPNRLEKPRPLYVGVRQNCDVAICGLNRTPVRNQHAGIAEILRSLLEGGAIHMFGQQEGGQRLKHRNFDMLGLSRTLAVEQGAHHGIGGGDPAKLVGQNCRGISGRCLGVAQGCQAGQSRHRLDGIVECWLGGIGPVLSETGGGYRDQVRVFLAQGFGFQRQSGKRRRPDARNHHIGIDEQFAQLIETGLCFEVEYDTALVTVGPQKSGTHQLVARWLDLAKKIALGAFHLDHIGPQIAQHLRRQRSENYRSQIDDLHVLKDRRIVLIGHLIVHLVASAVSPRLRRIGGVGTLISPEGVRITDRSSWG